MDWYVLFVKAGKEETVQKWLRYNFDPITLYSIVPKRKLLEKRNGKNYHIIKNFFPGYVFIKTHMDIPKYLTIKRIPNLIKVLNNGNFFSSIDSNEIALVLKLIGNGEIVDYSKIFLENSIVCVKSGPLLGLEGIIKKVNKHTNRAKIAISLLGDLRVVDVGIEILYSPNS